MAGPLPGGPGPRAQLRRRQLERATDQLLRGRRRLQQIEGRGEARQAASTLRSTVERYRLFPHNLSESKNRITLSLGAASVPTDAETEATAELLKAIAKNHSVVVVEHDMAFVRDLDCKVTVLHEGSVLAEGSIDHVTSDKQVIEVYLGR